MLTFIDFSGDLLVPDDEVCPRVRAGKFIHVCKKGEGRDYVVFSPEKLDAHHRNILDRFCRLIGVPGRWVSSTGGRMFRIDEPGWDVGGGYIAIDDVAKCLYLSGFSFTYGEPPRNHKELQSMLLNLPEFAGYRTLS